MATPNTKLKPLSRSLQIVPGSINEAERTVTVDFGTNTPVLMRGWEGSYNEILSFEKKHVRMERLNAGAPLLKDHNPNKQIGVVQIASIDGEKGMATVRFGTSKRAEKIWIDVKDGIRKCISVGYRVYEYIEQAIPEDLRGENYIPTYTAVDWEPYEVSSVSIPADYKAGVRSEELEENEFKITNLNRHTPMTPEQQAELDRLRKLETDYKTKNPSASAEEIEAARKAAVKEEKTRSSEIILAVRSAKLKPEFAEKLINDGTSLSEARAMVITEFAKEDSEFRAAVVTVGNGLDECEKVQRGLEEALTNRIDKKTVITDLGRNYANASLGDMCRMFLEARGIKTQGWERRKIAQEALSYRSGGAMSTTDFPFILGNVFNNMLLRAYKVTEPTFKAFTRESSSSDFRDNLRTRMGAITGFKKVVEGGEYEMATFGESQEKYKVAKFGVIVPLTWEAMVNDTLDAFSRIPAGLAMKARTLQSNIVWGLITDNNAMADGIDLFHADHGNYDASGNAIDIASLTAGRLAIRSQKENDDYLDIEPEFLIVSPKIEGAAFQYTSANYVPAEAGDINPKFNTKLKTIVEPRLLDVNSGNGWYLSANPNAIDTIEYSFLEGQGEMFTETRQGFNTDGVEMKARMVFGAGVIDYRGFFHNVGA